MIRYNVTKKELEDSVNAEGNTVDGKTWLQRASERTETFRALGYYEEKSSIWSEVKPAYMRLQGMGKCAYCEREMEPIDFGKVEQDVEHFRPKGSVKVWKISKQLKDAGVTLTNAPVPVPPAKVKGYHLLPYHPFNYAAACKPCNSILKKDYFPIAGAYTLDGADPAALSTEQCYLIYPIGAIDDDPETLIEFQGTSPRPVATSGHARHRALVTIEFFKLDDPAKRKNLYRDRALLIMALFPLLQKTTQGTAAQKKKAQATIDKVLTPQLRHLNCAKSFRRLFESDPAEAEALYEQAVQLMTTIS